MNKEIIYAHEHITIDLSGVKKDADCFLNNKKQTIEEFKELKAKGVSTIIDVTNRGMGRSTEYVAEVINETGLNILQSTGYYKEPFLPEEVYKINEKKMANILVDEIINGIDETSVKASVIGEIGTSLNKIEEMEKKVFEASCMAHLETGVPIITHTTLGKLGLEQIEIFKNFNVDLSKVTLSHIDLSGDLEYMFRLLDTGVNIAFDTIGKNNYQPDEKRAEWLKALCERGYSNQIVMSMDITRKSHFRENGGLGYSYLIDSFLPRLYENEISSKHIENMLVNNIKNIYNLK
ncbi:MAG: TatD family hydrolase [Clostridium sp.]|jgi:phosphotriesterase-related protein|uniref:phosphotriesterase family protein n=1 Tax=Clostridium TaxID=1485 RepID=UPI00115AE65B|nr:MULTISPECIES: TatD family hydrolase [Clostridium]MBS6501029.1 TatD family hydrolase [Clostridium sp.]MDU1567716.1 TatD family hydrolase [Clostridium sp.]MDU2460690.1 TatD family hydrolase [Clostridium sp.]MDU7242236.1 TatD family hydrolase [Clostridium sp.]